MGGLVLSWLVIRKRYILPTPADEIHHAPTADGWLLALYRYLPKHPAPGREPVVLCHGMLSNRFNVDLDEEVSLARHLRAAGFDTWVMELRGHGGSVRREDGGRAGYDWSLDDYIQRDLPAAVAHVRRATGAAQVHYFGHSMGGMILYGACAAQGGSWCRSAVVTDAPATFGPLKRRARIGRAYAKLFRVVPPLLVLPFLTPVVWLLPELMGRIYGLQGRRLNMLLLSNAIIPWGSSKVLEQICEMLEAGRLSSRDGLLDYESGPSRITFPLMVVAVGGRRVLEESVRFGYDRAGGGDKEYLRLAHFTHSNLLVGEAAPRDLYPQIARWFERHSTGAGTAAGDPTA
jgi:pimeloyl-ACP methyl ester carboxylesterase